jgi:hypothetical protein
MSKRQGFAAVGVGATILIFAALALGNDSASAAKNRVYTGHFEGLKSQRVRLEIKLRRGAPKAVTFEAKNVLLFCDDDTEQRIDVGPLRVPMRTHAAFSRTIVRGQAGADRTYIGVDGRVVGDRAHGFFYYFSDPWDPPGQPYAPDCSGGFGHDTGGWTARRR